MIGRGRWLGKCLVGALVIAAHLLGLLSPHRATLRTRQADHGLVTVFLLPFIEEHPKTQTPSAHRRDPGAKRAPPRMGPPLVTAPVHAPAPAPAVPESPADVELGRARAGAPGPALLDLRYRPAEELHAPSAAARLRRGDERPIAAVERLVVHAQRPDCRNAYAGMGLLAIAKMVLDRKDEGCKW